VTAASSWLSIVGCEGSIRRVRDGDESETLEPRVLAPVVAFSTLTAPGTAKSSSTISSESELSELAWLFKSSASDNLFPIGQNSPTIPKTVISFVFQSWFKVITLFGKHVRDRRSRLKVRNPNF
jgi:hypothetical protein